MHLAARESRKIEVAEVNDGNVVRLEIAPEPERRDVPDPNDTVELRPRDHALATRDERKRAVFAKTGKRLGVSRRIQTRDKRANAMAMRWRNRAKNHERCLHVIPSDSEGPGWVCGTRHVPLATAHPGPSLTLGMTSWERIAFKFHDTRRTTNRAQRFLFELHVQMQRSRAAPRLELRLRVHPEQSHLLDRLRRARAAKARRTVGGDQHERQSRVVRLDRRGQQLRGRGARRRHDRDRLAVQLHAPDGEERGRTLVDEREQSCVAVAEDGQQRSIARAGADAEFRDAGGAHRGDQARCALEIVHASASIPNSAFT